VPGRLSPWDDFTIHQSAAPLGAIVPAQPSWGERFYFNLQREDGELLAILGGGVYPARELAECYLCRIEGNTQVNRRSWQKLPGPGEGHTRSDDAFSFRCEVPMQAWSFGVELLDGSRLAGGFRASREPFLYAPIDVPADEIGGAFDLYSHFVAAGTVELDGEAGSLLSVRDRTWGVRTRRARLHNWYVLHLGAYFLTLIHQERADGSVLFSQCALCDGSGTVEQLAVAGHELRFDPVDRQLEEGRIELAGDRRRLRLELARTGQAIRLAGAGYDDRQGDRDPAGGAEDDRYDLASPEVARRIGRGTMDCPVRAVLRGEGIDTSGVGVAETAVARDHVAYGSQLS
jgi:hypothetical protein